jgi:hypothetical protein
LLRLPHAADNPEGKIYRIDGGPAIIDFQSLLTDLDTAVGQVLTSDATFAPFASSVLLTASPDPDDVAALRPDVDAWYLRYHTIMTHALPSPPWGPARLDAVSMIFKRVTGFDLGPPAPSFLLPDNIKRADAPVRYPFIWNAPVQDKTQWPTSEPSTESQPYPARAHDRGETGRQVPPEKSTTGRGFLT